MLALYKTGAIWYNRNVVFYKKEVCPLKRSSSAASRVILLILIVFVLCITLIVGAFMILFRIRDHFRENPVIIEETEPATEPSFLFNDPEYGEIWVPDLPGVAHCSYEPENTVVRNGRMYYIEDEKITSVTGVDVSYAQEHIDWEQVKASGIDFAFIRCGCRTYGSGKLAEDTLFREHMEGALAAGLDVGIYFFSQAITIKEAEEEAAFVLALADGYDLTYPIVFDWEAVTEDEARTDNLSDEDLVACTRAFCSKIKEAGYTPMIYQNAETILSRLDLTQLADYDVWLAEHGRLSGYYYDYRIRQYSSEAKVPGIRGDVDINICFKPYTRTEG